MDRIALDTTFLIDLQNERRGRGADRGAGAFLRAHRNAELFLPVVARGEYLEAFDRPDSAQARELVDALRTLNLTTEVAATYAAVARRLRAAGTLIGTNALWIGATAKTAGLPLVTRNAGEFRRIPGLTVLDYAA
jgi:predicted nucleic acid-binding protein